MNADFHATSGFAEVCTHCSTRRHMPTQQTRQAQRREQIRSALLATLIGTALAAVLFFGLAGAFRP